MKWFKETIEQCPADEGWRVFVFSHAPPMGSGLRVLQENHVVNGEALGVFLLLLPPSCALVRVAPSL